MNKQKEDLKEGVSAITSEASNTKGDDGNDNGRIIKEPPVILLKTPTPKLFPKGSMKPSELKKERVQSEKVKKANEIFAAAAKEESAKSSVGGGEQR